MGPPRSLIILGFLAGMAPLAAQYYTGLSGVVLDPSKAAVPGAAVAVVNEETGFRRAVESASDGGYTVAWLTPGLYKITVRKEGFRTLIRFGVRVEARRPARVDFALPVGGMQETVTVEGTAPLIDGQNPSPGRTVGRAEIERLPLNGRGLLSLLDLTPGAVITPATRGEPGQFTINGQRPNSHYFTVDGVSANTGVSGGGLPAQPTGGALPAMSAFGSLDSLVSLEGLEELRVETSTAAPESGRLPGATVALTSRAGTNDLHGSLAWAFRHEWLSANDWFANRSGSPRAPLRLNDGGAAVGGPILRDRTFFFAAYEGVRLRQPVAWRMPVPSGAASADSPEWVRRLLNVFPPPNGPALTPDLAEWNGRNNRPSRLDVGSLRIDHALSPRATVFARLNTAPSASEFGSAQVNRLDLRWRSATLALSARPATGVVVDLRGNISYARAQSSWMQTGPAAAPCYLEPVIAFLLRTPGTCDHLVRLSIAGVGQVVSGREGRRTQGQVQGVAAVAWNHGSHGMRWGADYRRLSPSRRDATGYGSIIAESMADLLAGRNLWTANAAAQTASTRLHELSLYAQDTWQVTGRLTGTYGLRWEYNPAPEARPFAYFLDPAQGTVKAYRRPVWPAAFDNISPRASLAWRLSRSGRTVLRAAGGLYYDSSLSIATDLINGGPFNLSAYNNPKHAPFSMLLSYGFMPDLRLPRVKEWSGSVERALGGGQVISVGYVGSAGRQLLRREMGGPGSSGSAWIALATNHGAADYHGLQLQYRRTLASGLQVFVSYTWSHSIDNSSSDSGLHWAGAGATLASDRGSSDFDVRHAVSAAVSYALPRHGRSGPAASFTGGWFLDGVLRARSGFPITVLAAEQYMGLTFTNAFRPDLTPGQPIWLVDPAAPGGRRLNPGAFRVAPESVQGGLGRNAITGFGMSQLDVALRREFRAGEQRVFQVRVEAFNALNQATFGDPVKYLASPLFGQSLSMLDLMLGSGSPGSGLAPMFQPGGARTLQLSLRFRF